MGAVPLPAHSCRQILKDVFGYADFRRGQEAAMSAALSGRDVLCVMPTGSGKSLCFQVPALALGGLCIVVSPLMALMQDQVDSLRLAGVAAETINSSRSREENVASWRRVAAGAVRLLYLSPERLMTESMLAALSRLPVRLIAVDEAHCISQWGPAFRPDYEALSRLRPAFPNVPIMALTATADESTRADIAQRLFGGKVDEIVLGFDRPNIRLTVAPKQDWKKQLLAFVKDHKGQSGIIYCLSRKKTEETAEFLREHGVKALAYHAGMSAEQREAHQNAFMTEPYTVMAATIAFGMGIDKADVRYVFHTDLPASPESYYQEIGRAGRDGDAAEAYMLYGAGDITMRRRFIDEAESSDEHKRREHQRLGALLSYCEATSCRRQALLSYFGESAEPCGNCDACLEPAATFDATGEAWMVLDVIAKTGERYGATHIVDVLRGAATEKIENARHDQLNGYGSGKHRKKEEWRSLIRQLVAGGYLIHDVAGFGGLSLSPEGDQLLRGQKRFNARIEARARRREQSTDEPLSPARDDLFAALKRVRLELAQERGVPAYLIFPDRTLQEMARKAPRDLSEFASLNGVGKTKLQEFGAVFLEAVSGYLNR
ncbi:ATP-dependent DNA helicase RecQ [Rhizomicrobium palustre]|uniref:DNA helicase RecQ n=1 Tax=Rhizomicrobium palustre TaxID=189966 RepID=A0A846MY21_9PROT|nr:DNA helicase RecQ [Rhizomicrobium palustre]NIK88498.1 ATP-dependent DNA helicase RecQ [Rhizomicrobium palustre]